jgi:hypothetical protein
MKTNDDKNNNGDESREPERHTITIETLRRQVICKKRYGRATLTIRRWGGYSGFSRDAKLSKEIAAFRVGDATAEAVAWAFVRARVKSHSPTFSWKGADLGRLIKLVTDCSESPHFEAQTAEELAAELVKKQDEEYEQMKRLTTQFAQSFAGIGGFSKLLQPQLGQWATQQNELFRGLSRSFVTPAISRQLAGLETPSIHERMRSLGLPESARKAMLPTLGPGLVSSLVAGTLPRQTLLAQRVVLPDTFYSGFSKSLQRSLALYRTETVAPTLQALARSQRSTIGQIVQAAREAAELAEGEGEREGARDLVEVTDEVIEVIEAPSPEKLEQMVAELSQRLEERFDELAAHQDEVEKKQERQRVADLIIALLLCILQIYLGMYGLPLRHHSPPPTPPPQQPAPPPPPPPNSV